MAPPRRRVRRGVPCARAGRDHGGRPSATVNLAGDAAQAAAAAQERARRAAERAAAGAEPTDGATGDPTAGGAQTGEASDAHAGGQDGADGAGAGGDGATEEKTSADCQIQDARETEQQLLDAAGRESVSRLREQARRTKADADPDPEETARRVFRNRRLRRWNDDGGGYSLFLRATLADGARIDAALQPIDAYLQQARRDGRHEPAEAHGADALMTLIGLGAHNHTHHRNETGGSAGNGGSAGGAGDGGGGGEGASGAQSETAAEGADTSQPADAPAGGTSGGVCGRSTSARESKLIAHLDVRALRRGQTEPGERCELAGVGTVPLSVIQGLLGEAFVALVISDGVDVLNVPIWAATSPRRRWTHPDKRPDPDSPPSPEGAPPDGAASDDGRLFAPG